MLWRAYELWRPIEHETGADLLREVGGLMIRQLSGAVVSASLRTAQRYGLQHLSVAALVKSFYHCPESECFCAGVARSETP